MNYIFLIITFYKEFCHFKGAQKYLDNYLKGSFMARCVPLPFYFKTN